MKPINKIIGKTPKDYNMLIFEIMFNWAKLYSKDCDKRTQMLLANRSINNWFTKEVSKLLKEFRDTLKPFENERYITSKERCQLFVEIVTKVYEIYPSALISQYKSPVKTSIKKRSFNNN